MPRGIWIRTEKHKQNYSKAQKVKWVNLDYRKRMIKAQVEGKLTRFKKGHKINLGKFKTFSVETKRKMSLAKKGKHYSSNTEFKKGCLSLMKGKKHSDEARKKISQKLQGKFTGEKHWNWKEGKSFEPYPLGWTKTFKEQIRYRDRYKCQRCGVPEIECREKLHIHHLDLNKNNLQCDNLISLCRSCHTTIHNGRKYRGVIWMK